MKKIMITILVLFIFVIVYSFSHQTQMGEYFGNSNETQECKNHADCTAEFQQPNKFYGCFNSECPTIAIGTCFSAGECDGQPMVVIQCTGQWTCEKSGAPYGRCHWVCSQG